MDGQQDVSHAADADLVRASSAGDGASWALLVDRYASDVWRAARSAGIPDAAAAAASSTAWLRLAQRLGDEDPTEGLSVGTWLTQTALSATRPVAWTSAAQTATSSAGGAARTAERTDVVVALLASAAARRRARELSSRLAFARGRTDRLLGDSTELLLTALSLERASSQVLHAVRDVGPLTSRRGLTLCELLTGEEVSLMLRIEWRDVRTADRCPECSRLAAAV